MRVVRGVVVRHRATIMGIVEDFENYQVALRQVLEISRIVK